MKRKLGYISVSFAGALLFAACGKLSKADARNIIQKTYYDKDENAYCTWDLGHLGVAEDRKPTSREFDFITDTSVDDEERLCVDDLVKAGVLHRKGEPMHVPAGAGGGTDYNFTLANEGVDFTKTGSLQFPCGNKKLGEVLSVSTEGKKATVKYKRTITRDDALSQKLHTCDNIQGPASGEETQTMRLARDDDGVWAPDY